MSRNQISYSSAGPDETIAAGKEIGAGLNPGDVVAISGNLGAGKTHLVKGICLAFGIKVDKVNSPTFTLVNEYHSDTEELPNIYHFDFYRIERLDELFEMGYEDYFNQKDICIIEWPEKFADAIPDSAVFINMEHESILERTITVLD